MKVPPAIRGDYDPFFPVLGILRWTDYRCPYCQAVFRRDYWPHNVKLGDGERTCTACAKVFDDGSREWPELGFWQKFRFMLPPGILAMAGSFLFCAIFLLFIAPPDVVNWLTGTLIVGFSLLPTILWSLVRLEPVRRSRSRYEYAPSAMRRKLDASQD
jgi:hypothetical protein